MNPKEGQFKGQLNAEPSGELEVLEHQYQEAMSQDPRYLTDEDKQEMSNFYDKQAKEMK
jgi:hypothetical protein